VLAANLESLQSIFRAYAASSLDGSATDMDMEEFHDFVIESDLVTDMYGFDTMSGQFTKANAGSNDTVLEFHEFLTMLVRISFFRANPQYGMRKGDSRKKQANVGANEENADKFGEERPLPGCLSEMLTSLVLPNARMDTYAAEFKEKKLSLPEVQAALGSQLDQWLGALEGKLLLSDVEIEGFRVRLTEPQAKAAFIASAEDPQLGLSQEELPVCIARTACDKYKHVVQMGAGQMVTGFLSNLLGDEDEEDVVMGAVGSSSKAIEEE